jgi:hypothetical protein
MLGLGEQTRPFAVIATPPWAAADTLLRQLERGRVGASRRFDDNPPCVMAS